LPSAQTEDIVVVLEQEHQELLNQFNEFAFVSISQWDEMFWNLMCRLKRHGAAMDFVVAPHLASLPGGDEVRKELTYEQMEIEELLDRMAPLHVSDALFGGLFRLVQSAVRDQQRREEQFVGPLLAAALSTDDRRAMGRRFRPIRQAPHQPSPPLLSDTCREELLEVRQRMAA
jgi:hypothetical protein